MPDVTVNVTGSSALLRVYYWMPDVTVTVTGSPALLRVNYWMPGVTVTVTGSSALVRVYYWMPDVTVTGSSALLRTFTVPMLFSFFKIQTQDPRSCGEAAQSATAKLMHPLPPSGSAATAAASALHLQHVRLRGGCASSQAPPPPMPCPQSLQVCRSVAVEVRYKHTLICGNSRIVDGDVVLTDQV